MFRRLLRDYLSLTRSERRGMQVLVVLVLMLVIFRSVLPLLLPSREMDMTLAEKEFIAFQDSISGPGFYTQAESLEDSTLKEASGILRPVPFDPNNASLHELEGMGIPERTARTLVNYRDAGAEFRKDSDLLRVYGMDRELYQRLKDYILIDTLLAEQNMPGDVEKLATGKVEEQDEFEVYPPESVGDFRKFELNQADSMQLLSVYGIGPVFARRILLFRKSLGGFYNSSQLLEIYGFSPSQYQSLIKRSYIDPGFLRKMDINRADAMELAMHPYLDQYQAESVIFYRQQSGKYDDPRELLDNKLLPDSVFNRVLPYLSAGR